MTKILVVDDSSLMRAVLRNFLKKKGFEVIEAEDGSKAVESFKENRPDLVFMDIKMPNMDGLTATKNIKTVNPSAKVVICSSLKEEHQVEEAKRLNVVEYVMKPFSSDDVYAAVKKAGFEVQ